ncbi:MAG TPA: hypothetical protein VLG68_08860 [Gammaproteobacteria bacterium]|nr:hypothetical protein [Gammaproteobacteria bacterium]
MQITNRSLAKTVFVGAIIASTIAIYSPGLKGGFALDDFTNVVENPALPIHELSWDALSHAAFSFKAGPTMRPISMLSFALNSYVTGISPYSFKLVNLAIHVLNGLLVFLLLKQLLATYRRELAPSFVEERLDWLALIVGALWILHPLNFLPVLYVVQRETTLSAFFVLAGINVYLWARREQLRNGRGAWVIWIAVPLLTLVAILCKESGALLPVYTFVLELFILRFRAADGRLSRTTASFYATVLLLPGCIGLALMLDGRAAGFLSYANRDFTLTERLMSEARVVWLYIRWTLWPEPGSLGLYHDDIAISRGLFQPLSTAFALAGIIGLLAACALLYRRRPLIACVIALFLSGQLIESTIFPLELAYEHRCYIADLGILLAIVDLVFPLSEAAPWRLARYVLLASVLGLFSLFTWQRAFSWRDNLSFAQAEAAHHPASPYATYMLGQTYANLALFGQSELYPQAVEALETASAVPSSSTIPDVSLILVEAQLKGRVDAGLLDTIAHKLSTRRPSASDIQALTALVDCISKGNCRLPPESIHKVFKSALSNPYLGSLREPHADFLVMYGNFISSLGERGGLTQARGMMAQAAALVPSEPQYQANLVTMDIAIGDTELARKDLEGLRKLNYLGHLDAQIQSFNAEIAALQPHP